jgi:hypothetical protein
MEDTKGQLPLEIGNLTELNVIEFTFYSYNGNKEFSGVLPASLCDLVNLVELKIARTSIEGVSFD